MIVLEQSLKCEAEHAQSFVLFLKIRTGKLLFWLSPIRTVETAVNHEMAEERNVNCLLHNCEYTW